MTDEDVSALAGELGCESFVPLPRDVSPRRYYRGFQKKKNRSVILMRYPLSSESSAELRQFIHISMWLAQKGIKTPAVYHGDLERNFALLEDLGSTSFGRALKEGADRVELYTLATEVLRRLRESETPGSLPPFESSRIRRNVRQFVEYALPVCRGEKAQGTLLEDYLRVWDRIEKSLPPCPRGFLHGDYHLENLMVMENAQGLSRCALIDFQDALEGPLPYDLVNLLEDARVDVPENLREKLIALYCQGMNREEGETVRLWYRVLGTQFHSRVTGLFIMLAAEQGRDEYLIHLQRLKNYIEKGVQHPALAPLKEWLTKEGIDFSPVKDLNGPEIRKLFQMIIS